MMAMLLPSEPEKQRIIDSVHQMKPSYDQIEKVCRAVIGEQPNDVYSRHATTIQAISSVVDRAAQLGLTDKLLPVFRTVILDSPIERYSPAVKPLDIDLATQFGNMFTALLDALGSMSEEELDKFTADIDTADMTDFKDKIENRAKFSKDKQELAMRSRTEISVLQRIAKKLGYSQYNKLKKKVMYLYFRICSEYPAHQYNADYRLERLLEHLYEQLPPTIREKFDESLDHLTGVIFDTAYDCYIFND